MSSWALARPHRTRELQAALLAVAVAVPLVTLPSLPQLSWWPALLGLAPWVLGNRGRGAGDLRVTRAPRREATGQCP